MRLTVLCNGTGMKKTLICLKVDKKYCASDEPVKIDVPNDPDLSIYITSGQYDVRYFRKHVSYHYLCCYCCLLQFTI